MEQSIDISRVVSMKIQAVGGITNLAVNGSVTPVVFEAKPPAGKKWRIERMVGYLEGANPFSADTFADIAGGLVNGVDIKINGSLITNWKINRDIASQIPVLTAPKALGKEDRTLAGAWHIHEAFGNAILVDENGGIQFVVNDDLSTVTAFFVTVQGQEV